MPVQFHVDPDFYDHPKTAGMSDAAFSLWVRAGSFSVAKLTDGFIAEAVLAHTLRSDTSVADELVERGLWRRRRGGYVFHQWDRRNLTRQRVEDHNRAEAKRKRESRQKKNGQVSGHNVRADTDRTPGGLLPESESGVVWCGSETKTKTQPSKTHDRGANDQAQATEPSLFGDPDPPKSVVPISRKADETFDRFWATYPRRNAIARARTAWDKAIKREDPDVIIAAARRYADSRPNLKYAPYPATWLNGDSWTDEPLPASSGSGYVGYQGPSDESAYLREFPPA